MQAKKNKEPADLEKQAKIDAERKEILSARRVMHNMEHKEKVHKEGRLMRRIARKSVKVRVFKPKPVRRPNKMVTVVSVGGVPVEEEEDEYTYF